MGSYSKLREVLEKSESFLILGHEHPDGDSLGSVLAMGTALTQQKKRVKMVSKDPIPPVFKFLPSVELIESDFCLEDFDAVLLLDIGNLKRTGFPDQIMAAKKMGLPIINIDHHPKNDLWRISKINYVSEKYPSTSSIVYDLFKSWGIKISSSIATCLLTGLYNDTGGFQHTNTTPEVLSDVADLLLCGAKLKKISEYVSNTNSLSKLKLWGIALDRVFVNKKYGIIGTVLTYEDIKRANASHDDVSGIVNLINSTPDAKIALLIYESEDGKIRGSLRTESEQIDVSKLADLLGGGGHKKASGFMINGSFIKNGENSWVVK